MATIEINGAQIYYELLGEDHPGQAPILLIHGSTSTGQEDWGAIAPILARRWRVILPDCRGHGRSSATRSYSFREMAADLAQLVRALGYERAHVIGHSNGGNVALVMLVEHPDVIQTAIPQAANAYVSQDLIDKEPGIFDPERVRRESPGWMNDMIRLHGPTHGPEYWRELLQLTVAEIIAEPNYTPEMLAGVQRPALIIQGADDPVNAPAHHAAFMHAHIPYAEAWVPKGIHHTVHDEIPAEWLAVVQSFLERRGDALNNALYHLKQAAYADDREWVFSLQAASPGAGGVVRLAGETLNQAQLDTAVAAVTAATGAAVSVDASGVRVLLTPETPWALVNRGLTDLYARPTIHSERLSQGLLGETLRILEVSGSWARIRMEHDGYMGWAMANAIFQCGPESAQAYRDGCAHHVQAELLRVWDERSKAGDPSESREKLAFGSRVMVAEIDGEFACLKLPDGRSGWVRQDGLLARAHQPQPDAAGIQQALKLARRFIGVPYLWGGRSPFGYDCSGLVGAIWSFMGIVLPRDADRQRQAGQPLEGDFQPGDLLFFRRETPIEIETRQDGVAHVAISLGGSRFLHASGTVWGVTINSLDPADREFSSDLRARFIDARRYTHLGRQS